MKTSEKIEKQIKENLILLYMKGSPEFPECGFSEKVVKILFNLKKNFFYVNVLENQDIRSELPKIANWPTFPQLWIKGRLIGGCDIVSEMYRSGELKNLVKDCPSMP